MSETLKTVADSRCIMTEVVLPTDTNGLGTLMGGKLMLLMDKCAGITAMRHANRVCVTVCADAIEFQEPILEGEIVILESWINRVFGSTMEIEISVRAENPLKKESRKSNRALFTFVALGDDLRPTAVAPVRIETKDEQRRYEEAAKRRAARLCLFSGRLRLEELFENQENLLEDFSTG